MGAGCARSTAAGATVLDLGSLWAGPLCGSVLVAAGCRVWKTESVQRPDGARLGDPAFFDGLNRGKSVRRFSTRSSATAADSPRSWPGPTRDRGLAARGHCSSSGSNLEEWMSRPDGPTVWVSITGHGRTRAPERIGFGDDAAVAGGLIDGSPDDPWFLGDAVADPLTGLRAAAHVLEALASGQRTSLDVSARRHGGVGERAPA
ncbi:MAG: CoA transferase [Ilumatobacteraceae bacterium]